MDGYYSFDAGTIFPLPNNTNPLAILPAADPTVQTLATFFAQLLNTNLQPAFSNACAAVNLSHSTLPNFVNSQVVAQTIAYELDETLLSTTNFKFPLLYIYNEGEEYDQWTLTNLMIHRHFTIAWILPPLTPTQYTSLYPFLQLATKTWLGYGQQGYDPKVHPNGPNVWKTAGVSFGTIESCEMTKYEGTMMKNNKEMAAWFPCLEFRMSLMERYQAPVPQNYPLPFNGATVDLSVIDGYNPANPIDNFIDGYIYPNIVLNSCSPATGSIGGGTLLTIQGIGFVPEKLRYASQLTICGSPASAVSINSASIMAAVTNPGVTGTANITGDIVFTDLEGNQYTLVNGYTYTP